MSCLRAAILVLASLLGAAAAPAQDWAPPGSRGAVHVYMLRGFGDGLTSGAVDDLGAVVARAVPGALVRVLNWHEGDEVFDDALAHAGEPIVLVGFSLGSESASEVANRLARRGIPTKVVGLDPMCAAPSVRRTPLIDAVNVYATPCGGPGGGRMQGARNVRLPPSPSGGTGLFALGEHAAFPMRPPVQSLVVGEILGMAARIDAPWEAFPMERGPMPWARR